MERQAESFFLQELVFFVFFKVQFFGGDRAGDLSRIKTKEILHFPGKKDSTL